jgi:hypothetical protein
MYIGPRFGYVCSPMSKPISKVVDVIYHGGCHLDILQKIIPSNPYE